MKTGFFIIAGFFFSVSLAGQGRLDSLKTDLREYITKSMKTNKVTGLSIALVSGDSIIWAEGFGFADKEAGIKASPSTIYRVGSVSKLFTASAIMQLSEQGKIDIDKPVSDYISAFKPVYAFPGVVTARNLMTHHSGLPSDLFQGLFNENPPHFDSIVPWLSAEKTCAPAEYILAYSNPGFTLLGSMVSKVSGMEFNEYMQKNLFAPMEMKSSTFYMTDALKPEYSKGYDGKTLTDEPPIVEVPAGMLHSTVLDLSNFIRMTFNDGMFKGSRVLATETLRKMQTQQNGNVFLDGSGSIGLCWFLSGDGSEWGYAGGAAEHGGDTHVFHAQLTTLPAQKIGVVVLTNSLGGGRAARGIATRILKKYLKSEKNLADTFKSPVVKFAGIEKDSLKKYQGFYTLGPEIVELKVCRNGFKSKMNGMPLRFRYNNQGTYTPQMVLAFIKIPVKSQQMRFDSWNGKRYLAIIANRDTSYIGVQTELPVLSGKWAERCGDYELINDSSDYALVNSVKFKIKDGRLTVKLSGWMGSLGTFSLLPSGDDEAVVAGIGRSTGYRITFKGEILQVTGLKFRKKK